MRFSDDQRRELWQAARHAAQAHVRVKALVLWNVANGRTKSEAAIFAGVTRTTLDQWIKRYLAEGVGGLSIKKGRGRKEQIDLEELHEYLRQSPRQFGLEQNRWTLRTLAETVPSLKGVAESSVYRALRRMGFGYKRGQPSVHSPDPQYEEKRGRWKKL